MEFLVGDVHAGVTQPPQCVIDAPVADQLGHGAGVEPGIVEQLVIRARRVRPHRGVEQIEEPLIPAGQLIDPGGAGRFRPYRVAEVRTQGADEAPAVSQHDGRAYGESVGSAR